MAMHPCHRPVLLIITLSLSLFVARGASAQAVCEDTPFLCAVARAVDTGFGQLRTRDAAQHPEPIALKAMLTWRDVVGWQGRAFGYVGLPEADQASARTEVATLIATTPGLRDPAAMDDPAAVGRVLWALTEYIATGGPDDTGSPTPTTVALANGINALTAWSRGPAAWQDSDGRPLPATAIAWVAIGLVAAEQIIGGVADPLAALPAVLAARTAPDGSVDGAVDATIAAAYALRLALRPCGEPAIQAHLRWLEPHWALREHQPIATLFWWQRLLEVCHDDGLGGAIYTERLPRLDPVAEGFERLPPSVYFDLALHVVERQRRTWRWGRDWTTHSTALLILLRGPGVLHSDDDEDGLVNVDDNCPAVANPDQADGDLDEVGDACDNCVAVPNRDQADFDADGIGDACADACRDGCCPIDAPCSGLDHDCDGAIDEHCLPDEPDAALADMGPLDAAPLDAGSGDAGVPDAAEQAGFDAIPVPKADAGDLLPIDPSDGDAGRPDTSSDSEASRAIDRGCHAARGEVPTSPLPALLLIGWISRRRRQRRCRPGPR